jgi:hypothetical protein
VALDDLHPMCVALLNQQRSFLIDPKVKNCDQTVKIVFHYTRKENMANIRDHGLMSHLDRASNNVAANYNGKYFNLIIKLINKIVWYFVVAVTLITMYT